MISSLSISSLFSRPSLGHSFLLLATIAVSQFFFIFAQNVIIYSPDTASVQETASIHTIVYDTIALRTTIQGSAPGWESWLLTLSRAEDVLSIDILALAIRDKQAVPGFLSDVQDIQRQLTTIKRDIQDSSENLTESYDACTLRKADADESYNRALSLRQAGNITSAISASQDAAACQARFRVAINAQTPLLTSIVSYEDIALQTFEAVSAAKTILMTSPELLEDNYLEQLISLRARL